MLRLLRPALAVLCAIAALPSSAEEVPILRIYTYDSFAAEWGPGPALKAGFEENCVCVVEFTAVDSSVGALRRVQLEGDASEADMVLGLDTSIAGDARSTGLFAPHGLDLGNLALPGGWSDETFVPFDHGYFAFVYDKDKVAEPPGSFAELIGMPDDFRIALQDPRSDTPGLGLLLWIRAAYGEHASEIWAGLAPHVVTLARGWSESYSLFLAGEADMVLSYTTSPAYHAIAEGDESFAAAEFEEGHFAQVEVAGILRGSEKKRLAADFLRYLISPEGQAVIPTTNWMYPVADIGGGLPPAFPPPPGKVLTLGEDEIVASRAAWIEEALAALR